MVLDALYLVVPLLKQYLSFPRSCISTECVYSWGTKPQSGCKCAEEVANILLCMRGACGSWWWLTGSPSPPHWRVTSSTSRSASMPLVGVLQQPKGGPMGDMVNSVCCLLPDPEVLKGHLERRWGLSSGWSSLGGDWKTPPYLGLGFGHWRGTCPLSHIRSGMGDSGRAGMESDRFALPTMATLKRCVAAIISMVEWNVRSASVSEILNTPSRCAWPKPMYNSIKFSSWKESGENGVPLPWVATKMQMQFPKSWALPRVGSCATEVAAMDVMDITGLR